MGAGQASGGVRRASADAREGLRAVALLVEAGGEVDASSLLSTRSTFLLCWATFERDLLC